VPDYRLERPVINGKQSDRWYVVWTAGRRTHRLSTRTNDKVAARKFLAQFAALQDAPPETFTVSDLCDAYLKDREEDPSVHYPKAIANSLRHVKDHLGSLPPSMISPMSVKTYVTQRRKEKVSDSTISKELRFLRQAMKYGKRYSWIDDEPTISIPGEGHPRDRFLTREEFARLFFHASPLHLRVFLALAICTAARGKHILALTWDRVDFAAGMVRYRPGESSIKRTAQVPMNAPLRRMLEKAHEARSCTRVVEWNGKPVKSVRRAYERACKLAGLTDAHRHDLRRTAASWAVQDGATFDEVATMLGDSVETTRKHYAVFSPTYLQGVVTSIADGGKRA
jgi:integrase